MYKLSEVLETQSLSGNEATRSHFPRVLNPTKQKAGRRMYEMTVRLDPIWNAEITVQMGRKNYRYVSNGGIRYQHRAIKEFLTTKQPKRMGTLLGTIRQNKLAQNDQDYESLLRIKKDPRLKLGEPVAPKGETIGKLVQQGWCGLYMEESYYKELEEKGRDPLDFV